MNVLIADDCRDMRERLAELIGEVRGLRVAGQAGDVDVAIARIGKLRPSLVLLDLRMPGGSGLDVLRALPVEGCHPVALMISNQATPQHRREALRLGAHSFFDKSKDWEHLRSVLETLSLSATAPSIPGTE